MLGDGPPLVLLHGWTLDRRVWIPQVQALTAQYRLIAIDRRGFGQSTAPPDLAEEPNDLLALADVLGLASFGLIGMSQGARVALAYAVRHPERVSALAVQGTPLSGVPAVADELPFNQMAVLAAAGELATLRYVWRQHPLMQVEGLEANTLLDRIVADYTGRDLAVRDTLDIYEAELAPLSLPALVITGAREPLWRHEVAAIVARALGAERLDIAEAGHLANLCRSDLYNRALLDFLAHAHAALPTHLSREP